MYQENLSSSNFSSFLWVFLGGGGGEGGSFLFCFVFHINDVSLMDLYFLALTKTGYAQT